MSIAVLVKVHDGLVLAADSASTLVLAAGPGVAGVGKVYDNANKIFNLYKGKPLGCIAYGTGSIGSASIGTLIKDLRHRLTLHQIEFDPDNYTMEKVSKIVAEFLGNECTSQNPATLLATNIGLIVAGYSTGESLGESWFVEIRQGMPQPPILQRPKEDAGINWGGQAEVLHRMVLGYSPQIFQVLADASSSSGTQVTSEQLQQDLTQLFLARLQAQIVFAPMPIQDAVELADFLVHSAKMFSRFSPGAQMVGGPTEIAAITKHEGFKWISRKHYYDHDLNQEPTHVVLDRQSKDQ